MKRILLFTGFLIITTALFWLLNWFICKLAYPKNKRYLHNRLIVGVLLTSFIAANVFTLSVPITWVDGFVNSESVHKFILTFMPNRSYELLYLLLNYIGLNLIYFILILIVILILKLVFARKTEFIDIEEFYGISKVLHFPWWVTGRYYKLNDDTVTLTGKGFKFGIWLKAIKWIFAGIWLVETIVVSVSVIWAGTEWNTFLIEAVRSWYMLPMIGFLLTEQLQLFFETDYDNETLSFDSEDIEERLEGDIKLLQDLELRQFKDSNALLLSDYDENGIDFGEGILDNDVGNTQEKDCSQPEVLSIITEMIKSSGRVLNHRYVNAIVALLNGQSINICDVTQGEFFPYLAAYLNFFLSQSKTALILCEDDTSAESVLSNLNQTLSQINSLYSVWNICSLDGIRQDRYINMIVCSYDGFISSEIMKKRSDFSDNLFCVVCADCTGFYSRDSIHPTLLNNILSPKNDELQYIMISNEDNDSLRSSIESYIKKELYPFGNQTRLAKTGVMVWREESSCRLQRYLGIGNALSPYMGTALPLALVAAKYSLPNVYLITHKSRAYHSYHEALSMNSKEVKNYLGSGINLESVLRYKEQNVPERQDIMMMITYDTNFNFLTDIWNWMKYGGKDGTLLHVVSPPYLLREYLAANYRKKNLYLKNNEFDSLIPYDLLMKKSRLLEKMVSLSDSGMTEDELMELSKRNGWEYRNVEELLEECLRVLFNDEEVHNVFECFHFEKEKKFIDDKVGFESVVRVMLIDEEVKQRLSAKIGKVCIVINGEAKPIPDVFRGNLYNYYLRGQQMVYEGNSYTISSIVDGAIYVSQEMSKGDMVYYPISEFEFIDDFKVKDKCIDTDLIDLNLFAVTTVRRIYGYWACNGGNDFFDDNFVQVNDLRSISGEPLKTNPEQVSVLEINIRKTALGDRPNEACVLLCYILNGLFKTLFPFSYQNLHTATSSARGTEFYKEVLKKGTESDINEIVLSMIGGSINGRTIDDEFVRLYVIENSCVEYGMARTLCDRFTSVLAIIREYLNWYMGSADESGVPQGKWLHFGGEALPSIFACEDLLNFCTKAAPEVVDDYVVHQEDLDDVASGCTFCGRRSLFVTHLGDGRVMCNICHDHRYTRKEEVRELFMDTCDFMEKGYHIKLPKKMRVRFRSAEAIRIVSGGTEDGRILGFYSPAKKQLWLESRGPKVAMLSTLIHELTHAWQFSALNMAELKRKLTDEQFLYLTEGHAVYTEIVTLRKHNESEYANRLEKITLLRDDEYGKGYQIIEALFKMIEPDSLTINPFTAMEKLVDMILKGEVSI